MRFPTLLLLTLLCFSTAFSQPKPIVQDKGNFGLHVMDDRIRQHKYPEQENQLLLIGYKSLQLLDLTNFKVIHTQPINLPYSDLRRYYPGDWPISPDGRRMVLTGLNEGSVVRIWKTGDGEVEDTIARSGAEFNPKTREIEISPDEKFLVMVNKHKSVPSKHRLLVWQFNGGLEQTYELRPQPKIDDSRLVFSPDGKYFALDAGQNLQIYETETGKLKVELPNLELPSWGWLDNETLASVDFKSKNFFETGKMLKAFDANNGRLLFKQRLDYAEGKGNGVNEDDTVVTDDTTLRPHPTRKIFVTSSNKFVKIFDSRTGELLQTVIEPMVVIDLTGKIKRTRGNTVLSADWSKDGRTLYVFSANRTSVSLWQLIED